MRPPPPIEASCSWEEDRSIWIEILYHYFLLHFTNTESMATNHGISDQWNRDNILPNASTSSEAPWPEFRPPDVEDTAWQVTAADLR